MHISAPATLTNLGRAGEGIEGGSQDDKALYNTGVVRLMGKNDPKGAIAVWQTFLKYHPDHPHKDQVQ